MIADTLRALGRSRKHYNSGVISYKDAMDMTWDEVVFALEVLDVK